MNVLILSPRLDVTFKEGPVPDQRGSIPPIRIHYKNFIESLEKSHKEKNDSVTVLEKPLWQFSKTSMEEIGEWEKQYDLVYFPHKNNFQLPQFLYSKLRIKYYMQMVFPWLFQIDEQGWGPTSSVYPIMANPNTVKNDEFINLLRDKQKQGKSKFDQPSISEWNEKDYVLFICQIPHDESIKFHGNGVSVLEALSHTVNWCLANNKKLIIKGHPVNPGSMQEMKNTFPESNFDWKDSMNINDLLKNSRVVVTVNSGVGMEALLYNKQVVIFGKADYDRIVNRATRSDFHMVMDNAWNNSPELEKLDYTINTNENFLSEYYSTMVDTSKYESVKNYVD